MEEKFCGAKTRSGTPCKRAPRYNGRCNLHGGKSLAWFAHPNYKHGLYSKYVPRNIAIKVLIDRLQREEMENEVPDA
jgi:hypothetical protein